MSNSDRRLSPWGEPVPASGWQEEPVAARPEASARRPAAVRTRRGGNDRVGASGASGDAAPNDDFDPTLLPDSPAGSTTRGGAAAAPVQLKRSGQLVERTVMVRILPKTSVFRRVRAVVALVVLATIIGLIVAAALGLAVWGIATAIHHASSN